MQQQALEKETEAVYFEELLHREGYKRTHLNHEDTEKKPNQNQNDEPKRNQKNQRPPLRWHRTEPNRTEPNPENESRRTEGSLPYSDGATHDNRR